MSSILFTNADMAKKSLLSTTCASASSDDSYRCIFHSESNSSSPKNKCTRCATISKINGSLIHEDPMKYIADFDTLIDSNGQKHELRLDRLSDDSRQKELIRLDFPYTILKFTGKHDPNANGGCRNEERRRSTPDIFAEVVPPRGESSMMQSTVDMSMNGGSNSLMAIKEAEINLLKAKLAYAENAPGGQSFTSSNLQNAYNAAQNVAPAINSI